MEANEQLPGAGRHGPGGSSALAVEVAAQTAYPISVPSARVRLAAFAPHLRPHGVSLRYQPTLTEEEYRAIASDAGPARKAGSLGRAALRQLARTRRHRAGELALVHRLRFLVPVPGLELAGQIDAYDFDDALYLGSTLASNRRFGWLKREAEQWLSYVRRARLVIAGNEHLAQRAAEHANRVVVVPSCVDPSRQPVRDHREQEVVTIGWIGSRSTADDLRRVLPAVAAMNENGMGARMVAIGAGPLGFEAPWLEQRPWSLSAEADDLASLDIGIMPLADTEWARGKCGYKLLQYFAAGVPVVASPVGVNTSLVGPGEERGLLATSLGEWRSALNQLATDVEARRQIGAEARRFVEADYSYQRWAPELAGLLREL